MIHSALKVVGLAGAASKVATAGFVPNTKVAVARSSKTEDFEVQL